MQQTLTLCNKYLLYATGTYTMQRVRTPYNEYLMYITLYNEYLLYTTSTYSIQRGIE